MIIGTCNRQATFGAAMRGELGPWAQSVAKYQMELRIQKELERIRQLDAKLAKIKNEEAEKNDVKKVSIQRCCQSKRKW